MYQLIVLYGQPQDATAFDEYYTSRHVPLVREVPGLLAFSYGKAGAAEVEPAYYFVATLRFESREALERGLESVEGKAAAGDVANFATGGVTMLFTEVTEIALDPPTAP